MLKRILMLLGVSLAALISATLISAAPSSAAPNSAAPAGAELPWRLERFTVLSANPAPGPAVCMSQSRVLEGGTYNWSFTLGFSIMPLIDLPAGAYTMTACLEPRLGGYAQTALLTSAGTSRTMRGSFTVPADGTYLWGVRLTPTF